MVWGLLMAERMRLERTMPCGTPHFQCGSLPLEYLSIWLVLSLTVDSLIIIADLFEKIKRVLQDFLIFVQIFYLHPYKTCYNIETYE